MNTISRWIATLLQAASGLVLVPFLLGRLGKEAYGLAILANTIVTLTILVDMGLRDALSRQLAEQVARRDTLRFNQVASTAFGLYVVLGTVLAAGSLIFARQLAGLFNVSEQYMPMAIFVVRGYTSVGILSSFLGPAFSASTQSVNRFDLVNYGRASVNLLRLAALFVVLGLTDWGLYGWTVVMIGYCVLDVFVQWTMARRVVPTLQMRRHHVRWPDVLPLFSVGGYLYLLTLSWSFSEKAHPFVLTTFLGPEAVALYAPALTLAYGLRPLIQSLANQLHPIATGLHVSGDRKMLQTVLVRGTSYTLLMGIASCVLLGVFAFPLCRLWLGHTVGEQYRATAMVLTLYMVGDILEYAAGAQQPILLGTKRLRFVALLEICLMVPHLGFSILLVCWTRQVWAVVIPTAAVGFIRRPILASYIARVCDMRVRDYLRRAYLRPFLVLVALTAVAIVLRLAVPCDSWGSLLGTVAAAGAAWIPLCWFIGFGPEDRASFRRLGQRMTARLRGARTTAPQ